MTDAASGGMPKAPESAGMAEEYYSLRNELGARGVFFSFAGYVSESILFSLGEALKQKMTLEETDTNTIKRVFSVFVEQVQNIIRYSAERVEGELDRPVELSSGVVNVGTEGGRFFVVCGNVMEQHAVDDLGARLEHLASLDRDGLRAYYKEKLRGPVEKESRGASLGLVEIARRASAPIAWDFLEIGDDQVFFCMKAYI